MSAAAAAVPWKVLESTTASGTALTDRDKGDGLEIHTQ